MEAGKANEKLKNKVCINEKGFYLCSPKRKGQKTGSDSGLRIERPGAISGDKIEKFDTVKTVKNIKSAP